MYKQSKYNFEYNLNDNYLMFNSYSGSICELTYDEYQEYNEYLFGGKVQFRLIENLYKLGFLIDNEKDETYNLKLLRAKSASQTRNLFFKILTTTGCNAKCSYCYEEGIQPTNMSDSILPNICDFISSCIKNDTKHITIQWYGGEPLLKMDIIEKLTKQLLEVFKKKEVSYSFTMISNGILLNSELIKRLKNENFIERIQITLDGYQEVYSNRKKYVSNLNDPFEVIIDNIDQLCLNGIKVDIRLNYDKENYFSILDLIDFLGLKYAKSKFANVYPFPIYGTYETIAIDSRRKNVTGKDELLAIIQLLVRNNLFKIPELKLRKNSCIATNLSSYYVLPDGNLLKCMMGTSDIVGNVSQGIEINASFNKWSELKLSEECTNCKILPLCQGGCRAGHLGYSDNKCYVYRDVIKELLLLQNF